MGESSGGTFKKSKRYLLIQRDSNLDVIHGYILEENIKICLENILSDASYVFFLGLGAE